MKKNIAVVIASACVLTIACKNNNTTTNMPDSGYRVRADSGAGIPTTIEDKPRGAVAVDSVKNGQFNVSGIPDSAGKKMDSAGKK